jgi:hypothetical protein
MTQPIKGDSLDYVADGSMETADSVRWGKMRDKSEMSLRNSTSMLAVTG